MGLLTVEFLELMANVNYHIYGDQIHRFGVFDRIISAISKSVLSFRHLSDFMKFALLCIQSLLLKKLECGGTVMAGFLQTLVFAREVKDWLSVRGCIGKLGWADRNSHGQTSWSLPSQPHAVIVRIKRKSDVFCSRKSRTTLTSGP